MAAPRRVLAGILRSQTARYVAGILLLAAAYYAAAKVGQSLRYTASVAAIWPPAGLGIAALYLWGIRWWPGIFLGEVLVNGELLVDETSLPFGSLVGQQAGNMAEIIVGALLLRRLIGSRAALDRVEQVGGTLIALGAAAAISATFGTTSMLAGGVIDESELAHFWRTWWLGDTAGCLVVLPFLLVWAPDPAAAWRRLRTWEGGLLLVVLALLTITAVSTDEPVTYLVFPALIWAAFRFGPPGATLAIALAAGVAIGFTANDVGPFSEQPIDHKTLSTQLYIFVAALTTLFLAAVVSELERSSAELAETKGREGELALEERHRIARDLHDSVSQSLFSMNLHTRTARRALDRDRASPAAEVSDALDAIGELTRSAQVEMRALIYELGSDVVDEGLVESLKKHASVVAKRHGLAITVHGPEDGLRLSRAGAIQLFGIGREALSNVVKHADAGEAWVRVEDGSGIVMEIGDDGCGFDPTIGHPGHFGIESMHSRAGDLGARLTISSTPGSGTVVRVEVPVDENEDADG